MRAGVFLLACGLLGQSPDPAYEPLAKAYEASRSRHYDAAISLFLKVIEAAPGRAAVRRDLAYTYLKAGQNELAREQFREAMRLEPANFHAALEYAFLCFETNEKVQARRIFDRVHHLLDLQKRDLDRVLQHPDIRQPRAIVEERAQHLDDLAARILVRMESHLQRQTHRLDAVDGRLTALDPRQVLKRGYALVSSADGAVVIPTAEQAREVDELLIHFADGVVPVTRD
ncbi:MAG: exodeoxyribonuclease VII large subunit [bacterium ADurb.Bin429]|nr:MAG: exodeoxyribonuclease VII large subunit [bacterium ADurb.Bin429]